MSDGASWGRKLWEEYFTEAISVLDFWHLARNIKVSLGAERISRLGRLANPLLALRLLKLNGEWESY